MPHQVPAHDWRVDEVLHCGRAGVSDDAVCQVARRHAARVELLLHRVDDQRDLGHRVH